MTERDEGRKKDFFDYITPVTEKYSPIRDVVDQIKDGVKSNEVVTGQASVVICIVGRPLSGKTHLFDAIAEEVGEDIYHIPWGDVTGNQDLDDSNTLHAALIRQRQLIMDAMREKRKIIGVEFPLVTSFRSGDQMAGEDRGLSTLRAIIAGITMRKSKESMVRRGFKKRTIDRHLSTLAPPRGFENFNYQPFVIGLTAKSETTEFGLKIREEILKNPKNPKAVRDVFESLGIDTRGVSNQALLNYAGEAATILASGGIDNQALDLLIRLGKVGRIQANEERLRTDSNYRNQVEASQLMGKSFGYSFEEEFINGTIGIVSKASPADLKLSFARLINYVKLKEEERSNP